MFELRVSKRGAAKHMILYTTGRLLWLIWNYQSACTWAQDKLCQMDFFSAGTPSGTSNQTLLSKLGLSFTENHRFVMSENTCPGSASEFWTTAIIRILKRNACRRQKHIIRIVARHALFAYSSPPRPEVYKSCLPDRLALAFWCFVLTPGIQAWGGWTHDFIDDGQTLKKYINHIFIDQLARDKKNVRGGPRAN